MASRARSGTAVGVSKVGSTGSGKNQPTQGPELEIPPRRPRVGAGGSGAGIEHDYMRRRIKAYPITDSELTQLQGIGVVTAACFSFGSGMLGFALNLHKDLSLAGPDVPANAFRWWDGLHYGLGAGGVALVVIGVCAFFWGKTRVRAIKAETVLDGN